MTDAMDDRPQKNVGSPLDLLLSDPERIKQLGSMVNAMLSNVSTPAASAPSTDEQSAPVISSEPLTSPSTVSGADGLASLLSNPALLQSLPQILATVKPMVEHLSHGTQEAHQGTRTPTPEECRTNLLISLKPFLSKERRQAIDSIIGLSRLSSVFQQLK